MAPDPVERKLAAILSADVVGYSRLMAEDEAATIRTLTAYRDQIATLVREHRGRVVDSPGDNLLAEFPTALDAVQGAVEIQRVIQARNADLPAERRMEFRIGVHMGDVSVEGDRLYGDGVNVAARLEGLAKPGAVCISGTVYEQVEKKLNVDLEDLGEQTLKNIARPVHVYGMKLVLPGTEREEPEKALPGMDEMTVPGFGGQPAIAVLSFDNLSGDPDQEYFADGIAEDIITRLSAWRDFPVIARNSSFTYKGRAVDVKQVSRELGVRYVVEGSVRRAGDRVRISAQLIDATTGAHVWAERYDRDMSDIFAVQDEITEAIVASLAPELSRAEQERVLRREPQSFNAWDSLQRGWWHVHNLTQEDNARARSLFEQTIELDPQCLNAYHGLTLSHFRDVQFQWTKAPSDSIAEANRVAQRGAKLDSNHPDAQLSLAIAGMLTGNQDEVIAASERAVELNPSHSIAYAFLGTMLAVAGSPEKGLASLEKGMRISPRDPNLWLLFWGVALAQFALERYEEAVAWAKRSLRGNPKWFSAWTLVVTSYAQLEQLDKARTALEEVLRLLPDYSLTATTFAFSSADRNFAARYLDGLRKAGLKE